ncbi:hypothetical protein AVEN_140719-1 [Araneus ventricosus]|uniref:Uncharacterized protein n=1 Tax=Araneus ventricosus TaxID=182803 RepID=A0A4Y2WTS3_ARAVE|nr:hypothetical protein AVEN_140719-1 [Araneus ventricosus]
MLVFNLDKCEYSAVVNRMKAQNSIPDSNFSLQQACHKFVMTRVQVCHKFVMTRVQVCHKFVMTTKAFQLRIALGKPEAFAWYLLFARKGWVHSPYSGGFLDRFDRCCVADEKTQHIKLADHNAQVKANNCSVLALFFKVCGIQ